MEDLEEGFGFCGISSAQEAEQSFERDDEKEQEEWGGFCEWGRKGQEE